MGREFALNARFRGPVVLVGHSLGGRLVLRAAESATAAAFEAVVAVAPAIEESALDLEAVARAVRRAAVVCSSRNDDVLRVAFRAGEGTMEPALGLTGVEAKSGITSRDCSIWAGEKVGHSSYSQFLTDLLEDVAAPK